MLGGQIAYIDLNTGSMVRGDVPQKWRSKYLGARGINSSLLYSLLPRDHDPLGPANPLLVGVGLLGGVPGFGTARVDIAALSPQSGNLGSSNIGGHFGPELRYSGYDHLAIVGQSQSPIYIFIDNGNIHIRDARHLWGKDTWETQEAIKRENRDEGIRALAIGPAGENLVTLANIMTGPKGAAGRYGLGAVMGSKKLKAIAVRGRGDVAVAHPRELLDYLRDQFDGLMARKWVRTLKRFGTPLLLGAQNEGGWLYPRNGLGLPLGEKALPLYADNLDRYALGMASCLGCPIHCRHRYSIKEGRFAGTKGEGPEFLGIDTLGFNLENLDMESVIYANHLCDRLGLDVGNTGLMIAFAMQLYEKGIITREDVGLPLDWGNGDSILSLIDDIAHRHGFGDLLAEGAYALNRLPQEARPYLPLFKNALPLVAHQRIIKSLVLCMAVSTLPGHQHRGDGPIDSFSLPAEFLSGLYGGDVPSDYTSYQGRARMVWWHESLNTICESLGCCRFILTWMSANAPRFEEYSQLVGLAAGMELSVEALRGIAERIYTTERLILGELGVGSRDHDNIPDLFFMPLRGGRFDGEAMDRDKFQTFLDEYYSLHDWDAHGVPTQQAIQRLGIGKVAVGTSSAHVLP
ncbi:MAG: aldehyde ferredoxin oxidoreductase family protein [Dehalococcoidia bacterium]